MIRVDNRVAYLFYLLSMETDYVTSSYLGKKISLTGRTIKSEITALKKYADKNGAHLVSKKRRGYKIVVFDKVIYNNKIEQLNYRFSLVKFFEDKNLQQRTNEILRFVLVQKKYICVDDIAEYMGLSVSSIKSEIKLLNKLLKKNGLRFKKRNEKGDLIIGSELNIRMLMLFVYDLYYHDAVAYYRNVDYLNLFKIEKNCELKLDTYS